MLDHGMQCFYVTIEHIYLSQSKKKILKVGILFLPELPQQLPS